MFNFGENSIFFHEQSNSKRNYNRPRKNAEDLPKFLRYYRNAQINLKTAAFLGKQSKKVFNENKIDNEETLHLPDTNSPRVPSLKSDFSPRSSNCHVDEEQHSFNLDEITFAAPNMLKELSETIEHFLNLFTSSDYGSEYVDQARDENLDFGARRPLLKGKVEEFVPKQVKKLLDEEWSDLIANAPTKAPPEKQVLIRNSSNTTNIRSSVLTMPSEIKSCLKQSNGSTLKPGTVKENVESRRVSLKPRISVSSQFALVSKTKSKNATQRSFRKVSVISSFRNRSNDVTRSSINFSLTKDPLDGRKLPNNGKLPPVDTSKGLWVLPEQNKASSEKEADLQTRQKKVALWLSEKLNGLVEKKELEQELEKKKNHTKKTFVRYYGDSRREQLMKYYQRIPGKGTYKSDLLKLTSEENSDKLMIQLADGSVTVHYPKSENVAIVASPVVANPHLLYVNCFDRDQNRTCLATFSPSGKSCCYRKNGSLGLILNEEGGLIKQDPYDETYDNKFIGEGKEENKSWLWPADQMLDKPLIYRLNKEMHLKIFGKHDIVLFFTCERECVKIQIGSHANLKQENKSTEKQTKLQRKIKSAIKKPGRKSKFDEIKKELKFSTTKRFELDQPSLDELADMRDQARRVVDKWMDFYRDTFGISSPHLKNITSTPKIRSPLRRVNSAKDSESYKIINYRENGSTIQLQSYRCPSAPISHTAKVDEMEFLYSENSQSSLGKSEKDQKRKSKRKSSSSKLNDEDCKESLESIFSRIHKTENRRKNKWMALISNQQMCPISTRAEIENIVTNNKRMNCQHLLRCRCHKTKVPIIHDLEFDYFIQKVVPPHQLIIVYLTNSIYPKCCFYEDMFQKLHATVNKNRAIPCLQSNKDDYRLFIYDIATANQTANRRSPLLLDRHNVVPGMTMIYKNKKLVFANNIFNGYGTAESDFKKQVEICKMDNNFLPDDFRFQPSRGNTGFRTHWGGEMGGAGVDERGSPGIFIGPPVSQLRRSRTNWLVASLPPIINSIVTSPKADCVVPKSLTVSKNSSKNSKKLAERSKSGKYLNISTSIISMYSSVNSEDEKRNPIFLKPI